MLSIIKLTILFCALCSRRCRMKMSQHTHTHRDTHMPKKEYVAFFPSHTHTNIHKKSPPKFDKPIVDKADKFDLDDRQRLRHAVHNDAYIRAHAHTYVRTHSRTHACIQHQANPWEHLINFLVLEKVLFLIIKLIQIFT